MDSPILSQYQRIPSQALKNTISKHLYETQTNFPEKRKKKEEEEEEEGVDKLDIDMDKQKVTVTGYVDQRRVLKVVRRTGRKAEFWPYPYDSEYYPYASQYLDESNFTSTYNYYMHGHNEGTHGYFPDPAYSTIDDHVIEIFSAENVHACNIM